MLEAVEGSLDGVAVLIDLPGERRWPSAFASPALSAGDLVAALGNGVGDFELAQSGSGRVMGVRLIGE